MARRDVRLLAVKNMSVVSRASVLLLAISFVPGCTVESTKGSGTQQPPIEGAGGEDPGTSETAELPGELRGTWLDTWSTSMGYKLARDAYDFDTGVWFGGLPDLWDMAPYRGFGIDLRADGSFVWVRGADGGVGGCQSYSVEVLHGTAVVDGSTIRFRTTAGRQRYESTCDPSLSYDRSMPNAVLEMTYERGATVDTGLPTLRLADGSGTTFDYFAE